ncbi:hypothetical protein MKW92_040403 [Papaver armeniacum]|nr:hypothetical protein MKW92_040403 [Papaver armeniacum]
MDMVLKGRASYSPPNDKKALSLFVMIWIVYSRFHAVGSFFDTYPNYSYDWSSCWSTLYSISMVCKFRGNSHVKQNHEEVRIKKSLSWWFGDPKTNNWETSLLLELQKQVAKLRLELEKNKSYKGVTSDALDLISDVSDLASSVNKGFEEDGRIRSEKHRLSEEEVAKLKLKLDRSQSSLKASESQTALLKEQKKTLEVNVSERDMEIKELKIAISNAELKFENEKSQLQKVILALEQGQEELETKLKNSESKVRKLVEEYKRAEVEHNEFRVLQRDREAEMRIEMERHLKAKINLGELKINFDTLRAERDELAAKVTSLATDVESRDEMICHMEEHFRKLHNEHKRLRRLEREVERQRDMIAEGAEEKREAIRQLCFSLEHYRNRYYEFRNAFIELTKQAPV